MPPDLELGGGAVGVSHWNPFDLSPLISQLRTLDDDRDHSMTTSNQSFQGESNFWDSSGPLFSIYYNAAKDEDSKMVEGWQKDAEGIVIFVSPWVGIFTYLYINWIAIDRSILRRSCCAPCCYRPGPKTKQSGYLRILPRQHLPGSRRPELNAFIHSFPCRQTIYSSEIRRLGEFSLVLELSHGPKLCFVGHIVTTMGSSISPYGSACTV